MTTTTGAGAKGAVDTSQLLDQVYRYLVAPFDTTNGGNATAPILGGVKFHTNQIIS